MFKQLKENLNNIFGSKEQIISKTYCKCGSIIKCTICKTKKTLKDLIDQTDPSIVKSQLKIQCKHVLPKYCKKCESKLEISKVFRQSLNQQNILSHAKLQKSNLKNGKQKSVQNEQKASGQNSQNFMICLKFDNVIATSQQLNHEQIIVKIDE